MSALGRREFLQGLSLAGAAPLLGSHASVVAAEQPPETSKIRLVRSSAICVAPQFVAEDLLHGEGFTEVEYVKTETGAPAIQAITAGKADLYTSNAGLLVSRIDAGDRIVILAGVHVGCYELIGTERIRSISDLKGKAAGVDSLESGHYFILATMLAHVGLRPHKDVSIVTQPIGDSIRQLREGKLAALVAFPPEPQELRAKKIGHVVVSTILDRPWSQYFCCLLHANTDFVRKHPIAAKRAVRAILKSANICAVEPERVAQLLVDKGYTARYDYTLQALKEIPYRLWREYNPEDAVRFYSLWLHEAGVIKSSPQKIIAQGTDWRFLNELKKELKG